MDAGSRCPGSGTSHGYSPRDVRRINLSTGRDQVALVRCPVCQRQLRGKVARRLQGIEVGKVVVVPPHKQEGTDA